MYQFLIIAYLFTLWKDTSGIAPLKENGRLHAEPKDKADILNRQYESTWTKEDTNVGDQGYQ